MKNSLFVIAGLLIIIWAIVFFNFNTSGIIHFLPALAVFIVLFRIIFDKPLSERNTNKLNKLRTNIRNNEPMP